MRTFRSNAEGSWDVVIVGGGIGGLAAAAYMARAGKRTLLLEARDKFWGRAENIGLGEGISVPIASEVFYALDQKLIRDMQLQKFGLRLARQAMPVTALRPNGRHLTLSHDPSQAREAIAGEGSADATAYRRFRRDHFALARQLRPLWVPLGDSAQWHRTLGSLAALGRDLALSAAQQELLELAARCSANAYLRNWFESDTLVTALSFDTVLDGISPDEPSSALLLLWRAAQEFSGLQGAVGQVEGGPQALAMALAEAAREAGAVLRADARVSAIDAKDGHVCGVTLKDDSNIECRTVISSVGARRTFEEFLRPEFRPFGSLRHRDRSSRHSNAKVFFTLKGYPPFAGLTERELCGRLILSESSDAAASSKFAAFSGLLPAELIKEVTVPSVADPSLSAAGVHVLSVNIPFLPLSPLGGWDANASILERRILTDLEAYAPGLKDRVLNRRVFTSDDFRARHETKNSRANFNERLLRSYGESVRSSIKGLYLCGLDAEPANAATGRAGRVAALLALAEG